VHEVVAKARQDAIELLARYDAITATLADEPTPDVYEELERLQLALDECDGWDVQRGVENHLQRFKLDGSTRFESLSGGMKRRVLLARCLISKPNFLMLDEPTNHLDMPSIAWLEEFLQGFPGALLFVTHDRMFLRRVATRIIDLDRGKLTSWPGNFDLYQERKQAALEAEETDWKRFDKRLADEETWIRQGIKARRTRNEGRVRALKRLRVERTERRERVGSVKMQLQTAEKSGREVIKAKSVSFNWPDKPIVTDFSSTVIRGDRVGFIGPNGCGKTTLLRLLLGELEPQSGLIKLGTKLSIIYFDQLRGQLNLDATVIDNISDGNDTVMVKGRSRHVIGYLKDFLFSPQRARSPVNVLSGGERNRLLLARLFKQEANVLVLDEPTNDLDAETLELLETVLLEFDGTVLLVSHDREFLNNVVTSTIVFDADGAVRSYAGGYDDWVKQRPQPSTEPEAAQEKPVRTGDTPAKVSQGLTFKQKQELAQLPTHIESLETEQSDIHTRLADPDIYQKAAAEVTALGERLGVIEAELEARYARWASLDAMASSDS
jgi:ATP-binding cassette subfamily F protein uup